LRDTELFLIVVKNHILATPECEYGGSELTDVKTLVDALTLEEKAALTAGEDMFNFLSPPVPRRERGWHMDAGRYDMLIGPSSEDIAVGCTIEVPDHASWR
jgi:hypothetical protein